MKVNGKSLHVLVGSQGSIITPLNLNSKDHGLEFLI